jgi:glycosyltransferase involved in cell wall biosynthesis
MRVMQVIQELRVGGAERIVAILAARLEEDGSQVSVAASGTALPGLPRVRVAPLPLIERRLDRVPAAALALRRALGRERPDLVHAHNPAMALVAALSTARGRTTPALVTVHGVPEEDYRSTARVLRLAGLPVVGCGPGVTAALEEHGVRVTATVVNGVAPARKRSDPGALRRSLGLSAELRLVLSVGRLVPQKNHALGMRAVAGVRDAALVVVGEGPLREELGALATSLGIAERVRLPGARGDARELMSAADLVLLSSRWEGLPLVALEALAAGTPVVATAVRGIRELLRDGESALLVPPDDAEALGAAVRLALDDSALAGRLRVNGLELAKRYSEETMGDRYLALYRSLARR